MQKYLHLILFMTAMLGSGGAKAQERVITGKVTAKEDGQGVPGANVIIKGTTRGANTDVDGNFTLALATGDSVLVISFVGYQTQTVSIGAQTNINVIVESDTKALQEVVVVGYGVQKKSDITGATANIKGEELSKQPVLTATQAMQGKVAGVQIISSGQPGSSPQIRLRGVSTALAGTTALFVVDGVFPDRFFNLFN